MKNRHADWTVPTKCEHGGGARYVAHRRVGETSTWRSYVAYSCDHDCAVFIVRTMWPEVVRTEAGKMVPVRQG